MKEAKPRAKAAIDVPEAELDAILGAGYGIFSGREVTWAKLRFSPQAARWAASSSWHPGQRASFDNQGRYQLEVPYNDGRELLMDILKYGPECEVLGPDSLRATVKAQLKAALDRY